MDQNPLTFNKHKLGTLSFTCVNHRRVVIVSRTSTRLRPVCAMEFGTDKLPPCTAWLRCSMLMLWNACNKYLSFYDKFWVEIFLCTSSLSIFANLFGIQNCPLSHQVMVHKFINWNPVKEFNLVLVHINHLFFSK